MPGLFSLISDVKSSLKSRDICGTGRVTVLVREDDVFDCVLSTRPVIAMMSKFYAVPRKTLSREYIGRIAPERLASQLQARRNAS